MTPEATTGTPTTLSWDDLVALLRPGRGTVTIDGDTIIVVGDGPLPVLTIDPMTIDPVLSGPALVATDVTIDGAPALASEAFGALLSGFVPDTAASTIHITTAGTISLPGGRLITAASPTLDPALWSTGSTTPLNLGVAPILVINGPLSSVPELPVITPIVLPNFIIGTADDNVLYGTEGVDWINGVGGTDQLWGGAGDDTYVVDSVGDLVLEFAGQGNDTVVSLIDIQIADDVEVENLLLSDTAVTGIGNSLDNHVTGTEAHNVLYGGAGDDTVDGRAGADHMWGGEGDDTLVVDDIGDVVIEYAGQGVDTVRASIDFQIADDVEIENLVLGGTAVTGVGNSLGNVITGNAGDNLLDGRAGDDTLDGGAGMDILIGGAGNDTFVFKAGYGRDFVDGFEAGDTGGDMIAFSTDLFADYAAAMANAVQAGDDVVFAIDADTTLTLWHTQLSALGADDFRFV